jgi:hypothetical protein
MIFAFLPEDVIHIILSYNDKIKYRNGKYMNQICKEDKRYNLLNEIEPIYANLDYEYVYETRKYYLMYYRQTYTTLCVDLENDKIIYTFCYNCEDEPENYHLWIRN